MRKFAMEYCESTGETTIILGSDRLVFSREEWMRNRHHFGQVVHVEEVRPMFALFGTKTVVRWADPGVLATKTK